MRRLITSEAVVEAHAAGRRSIAAPRGEAVISPGAWSKALELGVTFEQAGGAERHVDPSGIVRVRGDSVELQRFDAAGPGRNVRLADVVTSKDRSPMSAGFMTWAREDSFPWQLEYDEIDCVLEGVLHVGVGGRVVEAVAGDVVYIPKGSAIVFGTPSRVRIFYVTYPADWAAPTK